MTEPLLSPRRVRSTRGSFWVESGGAGSPVVLIHGLSGSTRWWGRNLDALAAQHTVHAIELVGFGRGRILHPTAPLPLRFDDAVAAVAAWIRDEVREPVHLVGHSMGGLIAILLAAQQPALVRSLVLVGSAGMPFSLDPRPHLEAALHPPRELWRFLPLLVRDFLRSGPAAVGIGALRTLQRDARDAMRHLTAPTLLIWGEHDPIIPLRYGDAMLAEIGGSRLVRIPSAGHLPMWDNADEFNRTVLQFFSETDAGPRHSPAADPLFGWGISGVRCGLAFRRSAHAVSARRIVLIHGLGTGTLYFEGLARALYQRGWDVFAPDLPGYGATPVDREPLAEQVGRLCDWAAGLEGPAIWLGHSTGCQLVERVREQAPDLVTRSVHVAPVWSDHPRTLSLAFRVLRDGLLEPLRLLPPVVAAYWEAGALRLIADARAYVADAARPRRVAEGSVVLYGTRDPLIDRRSVERAAPGKIHLLESAHGVVFSHPEELATEISSVVAG